MASLTLRKFTHACFELTDGDVTVLFDPGFDDWSQFDGLSAVLITHSHFDHMSEEVVAAAVRAEVAVYAPADAVAQLPQDLAAHVVTVSQGDSFEVGALRFDVTIVDHAEMHPDGPALSNAAYLVDGRVLVTGDAHPVVNGAEVLVTPINAPWLAVPNLIRYVREAKPDVFVAVHDALLSDLGMGVADKVGAGLESEGVGKFVHPKVGETIEV